MRHLLIYLLLLLPKFLFGHENNSEFIIVVQQDQSPITFSANTQSSFEIDWHNDGNWETITTAGMEEISHEFEGILDTLRIRGELNHLYAPRNIVDVVQWGDVHFTSMEHSFQHCLLLESFSAQDLPDLSDVANMNFIFSGSQVFNGDLSQWDVSTIQTFRSAFYRATNFNGDLSNWNVSSATNMRHMFDQATSFNGDLSSWDVSSVVNMIDMFVDSGLSTDNYDRLLKSWSKLPNLSNGVQLDASAEYCEAATERQTLIDDFGWVINDGGQCEEVLSEHFVIVVDGSTNEIIFPSVSTASSFDIDWENNGNWETITTNGTISHTYTTAPDTIRIRGELNHFEAPKSIIDVVQWGATNFTSLTESFKDCVKIEKFTASDLPDLSSVTEMRSMFNRAISFNGDLSLWDVSSVRKLSGLFSRAISFNGDLSSWDVSSVTNMEWMFEKAESFNGDISSWDVSSVTNMYGMFRGNTSFNNDLSLWNVSSVADMRVMFTNSGLSSDNYDRLLKGWSALPELIEGVQLDASVEYCEAQAERQSLIDNFGWIINDGGFYCDENLFAKDFVIVVDGSTTEISFPSVSTGSSFAIDWENNGNWETITTNGSISHSYTTAPDTIRIRGELNHFEAPKSIIDVVQWGSTHFTSMSKSFYDCEKIEKFTATDLPDLSSVTTMKEMFSDATSFNGDLSLWDVSSVTDMSFMFSTALFFNGNISSWDVSSVMRMEWMFRDASSFNGDLSLWDVSSVTTMEGMFSGASSFAGDLSSWNVSSVTDMSDMFCFVSSSFNSDLSTWDVSSVTDMAGMFCFTSSFNSDLSSWDVSSVTTMMWMFHNATSFNGDLSSWDVSSVKIMSDMFTASGLSTDNYDRLLMGWSALPELENGVQLDASVEYCESYSERQSLIDKFGWIINDGGLCAEVVAKDFIIVVDGSTTEINFPSVSTASSFAIDWENNGNWETITTNGSISHSYITAPDTIRIRGELNHFEAPKSIIDVVQWGSTHFTSMVKSFFDCDKIEKFTATDVPDLSNVTDMTQMFAEASFFNGDISNWDVSSVEKMGSVFAEASSFNGDLSNWDVSSVVTMGRMFYQASSFNGDISNWDVSSVGYMGWMFHQASLFNGDLSNWDVSKVTGMVNMFTESGLSTDNYDRLLIGWSELPELKSGVQLDVSVEYCESYSERESLIDKFGWIINDGGLCVEVVAKDFVIVVDGSTTEINFASVSTASSFAIDWENNGNWVTITTNGSISHSYTTAPDTIRIRGELNHFQAPKSIIDVVQWGSTHFTSMTASFKDCDKIQKFTASDLPDLSSVIDMSSMFNGATSINADLSTWDVSSVIDMSSMFNGATSVNADLNTWDVSSVTDMSYMFDRASSFNGDLSTWDVSSVKNMTSMFYRATSFNGDLSSWDVSSVEWMGYMFSEATTFIGNLSSWDVSSVVFMSSMFNGATSFNDDLSSWNVSSVGYMSGMFVGSSLSTDNYDLLLKGWSALPALTNGVNLDVSVEYCESYSERQSLIDKFGWVINDGGICAEVVAKDLVIVVDGSTTEINFPSVSTASSFAIDWENNDNWETITTNGTLAHSYTTTPDTIRLRGELNHFQAPVSIIDVVQWGSTNFTSMSNSFYKCDKIERFTATDVPDLSSVENMPGMFYEASSFNGDLSGWDVSSVVSMAGMFERAASFNGDISNWDVSSVTSMSWMFSEATSFNGDLSLWNVSSVGYMNRMFTDSGLSTDNYDLLLKGWSALPALKNGVNLDVSVEYCEASAERQSLIDNYGWIINDGGFFCEDDISAEDFVIVVDGSTTRINFPSVSTASSFDIDWENNDNWETITTNGTLSHSYTTTPDTIRIRGELNHFAAPKSIIDVVQWGSTHLTSMSTSFYECDKIEKFTATDVPDLSSVTDMNTMFRGASSFNGDLSLWDVSSVTNMSLMFVDASSFNGDLSLWDVSSVSSMSWMFQGATSFNGDLSSWDVSSVTDMRSMFYAVTSFNGDISNWDVSSVTNMSSMFNGATSFNGDISNWDVSSVTNMSFIFYGTTSFNGDISNWDVSSVTNMSSMFDYASSFNGDISNWDVSSVTDIRSMFNAATSFNGDISNWDVSSVSDMRSMFQGATSFNGDISNWDVSSVLDMRSMFQGATSFNGDISNWDVSFVSGMGYMFYNATSFNGNLSLWDVSKVTVMDNMFISSGLSTDNYDSLLVGWSTLPALKTFVNLGVSAGYCTAQAERQYLIDYYNWTINDLGENCSSTNARSIMNSEALKGVSGSSISDLAGDIEWILYDFSGQLIDKGSLTLQNGEAFRWQNLQTQYQKAGILRVFDRNGNVSVIKFIKE
ncbi:BspA family leucine-rich repeat surface protein [Flammeovirga aprica]|uniref:BspA family leucine-rich repeat surface protein n=1 Tax=Flammeovirga aprica JL-4 TaxID=694437 RepID=A0A7X9RY65_9BACT|nr:BspA family leucine-rich repeat surface protein [Flammeovirga aprica]NME70896.1 BspA family leucine-rich repeat surface protein [Flammeovirga aprica JL-4]